jgi:hypothetical protein
LPKKWTINDDRSFVSAYHQAEVRNKIAVVISKVRNDMRRNGVIS